MNVEKIIEEVKKAVSSIEDKLAVPYIKEKYRDPFKVLISTVISIRTKEENTIKACENLFKIIKTPWDVFKLNEEEIKQLIKNVGLVNQKSKWIREIAKRWINLCEKNNINEENYLKNLDKCKICDENFLLSLPGVGRKVANVYLILVCNKDVIAVDTHVHRVFNRIGIIKTKNPEETEKVLYNIIPKKYWKEINYLFVKFGRNICKPIKPKCKICPIKHYCKFYKEKG